jgi:DNA-binding MarR family transcriptional regulator
MKKNHRLTLQDEALRLERQLCFRLYAASRLVTRLYQPMLDPLGLTYPQFIVLMILWEDAPCSVSHIGTRSLLNSNTLTPLLKRLQQLGYVRRVRSAQDERVVNIELTDAGAKLKNKCACVPEQLSSSVDFSVGKVATLKQQLDDLLAALRSTAQD